MTQLVSFYLVFTKRKRRKIIVFDCCIFSERSLRQYNVDNHGKNQKYVCDDVIGCNHATMQDHSGLVHGWQC